jgi:hypothetical protein
VFNWNVKQLFVFVTANYQTRAKVRWPRGSGGARHGAARNRRARSEGGVRGVCAAAPPSPPLRAYPRPPPPSAPARRRPSQAVNEVVIWDRVVNNPSEAVLRLAGQFVKYPLMDAGKELRGAPVSLTLHWDVMPITGKLYGATRGNHTVRLPAAYCSEGEAGHECRLEAPVSRSGFDAPRGG